MISLEFIHMDAESEFFFINLPDVVRWSILGQQHHIYSINDFISMANHLLEVYLNWEVCHIIN